MTTASPSSTVLRPFPTRPVVSRLSPTGDCIAWLESGAGQPEEPGGAHLIEAGEAAAHHILAGHRVTEIAWSSTGRQLLAGVWDDASGTGTLWSTTLAGPPARLADLGGIIEQIAQSAEGVIGLVVADPSADQGVVGGASSYQRHHDDPQVDDGTTGSRRVFIGDDTGHFRQLELPADVGTVWEIALLADDGLAALGSAERSESGWYRSAVHLYDGGTHAWTTGYRPDWQIAQLCPDRAGRRVAFLEGWASDRGHLAGEPRVLDAKSGVVTRPSPPGFDAITVAWRDAASLWLAGWRESTSCLGWVSLTGGAGAVEVLTDAILDWELPLSTVRAVQDSDAAPAAAIGQRPGRRPEVLMRTSRAGGWRSVVNLDGTAADDGAVDVDVAEVTWQSADGFLINGLVVTGPAGAAAPGSLVVHVHGGPANLWHRGLSYGTLVLAMAGHAVLLPNPRGSIGRGQAYARANLGDPAGNELADLISGVDYCLNRFPAADGRVAFVGGSYGGYLTACAATMTERVAAAAVISGHPDLLSARHGSNNGSFYDRLIGVPPYGMAAAQMYLDRSPIVHVSETTAPTLVLHGADDHCTPVGQAREFHTALTDAGVPTELVIYPREGHGISEPDHELDLWSRVCRWFDHYLTA